MKIVKWGLMIIALWMLGSIISIFLEMALYAFSGITLGDIGTGLVILIVMIIGLVMYGRKQGENDVEGAKK